MFNSSTCLNHLLVIGIAVLLIIVLALQLLSRILENRASLRQLVLLSSPIQLAGLMANGLLGLVYTGLVLWMLGSNFNQGASVYLMHWWLLTMSQGLSLILISFALSVRRRFLGATFLEFWSVLLTTFAAYVCCSSVAFMVADKGITAKACLDVVSLPGALLIVYGIWHIREDGYEGIESALYNPLNTETVDHTADSDSKVTPFAKAGFFSVTFWWLHPLMKMGYEKPLAEKDVPLLDATDRAYNQYMMFLEKLNSDKQLQPHGSPSVFWTIISCHKRGIMVSGFCALLKVLTLSSGPLLLKAFINVSLGEGAFKYEGFVLAATIFFCKCCETVTEAVVLPH